MSAGITGKPIVVYSTENATVTKVTTDWKQIELTTHKEITIQIGTPITEIPNYHVELQLTPARIPSW